MSTPLSRSPSSLRALAWARGLRIRARTALRSVPGFLRVGGRGLALLTVASPGAAVLYVLVVAISSAVPVAQVWLGKVVVDELAIELRGATGRLPAGGVPSTGETPFGLTAVLLPATLYALTLALASGLAPVVLLLSRWLQDRTVAEIDRRMMRAGECLTDLYRIERPAFHDEWNLLRFAQYTPLALFTIVQNGAGTLLTVGGLLLLMAQVHPLVPLALVVLSAPYAVALTYGEQSLRSTMERHSRAAREMDYCARITTEPGAAKEVRVFGLSDFFRQRFRDRFTEATREVGRRRFHNLGIQLVTSSLHIVALAGGFWYVAAQAGAGRLTLGDVALYLGAIAQTEQRLRSFSQSVGFVSLALIHLRALFSFLDGARPAIAIPPDSGGHAVPAALQMGIELRDVTFRYPESPADVLQRAGATLPAGRVTALVGANGAGKSTLVKLLTRMYDPVDGEIVLDGVPLHQYDLESLRRRIAVVYQDFARFSLTLRENIAVGAFATGEDGDGSSAHRSSSVGSLLGSSDIGAGTANGPFDGLGGQTDRVATAARWAGADAVAAKLPRGYDTELTRRFTGGVELSGGEWQKVALARAFIRDAALVILDEPTAALDAEAEYRLFERFRELVAGKTALLISHRFSTVRMADHILVLEGGCIVEAGSHDELLALGGRYATLYEMQAGRYR